MQMLDIKDIISEIKYRCNCAQKDIAIKLGVKPTYLSDVISGRVPFSLNLKENISEQYSDLFFLTSEGKVLRSEQKKEKFSENNSGVNFNAGGDIKDNNVAIEASDFIGLLKKKDEQIDRLLTLLEKR